MIDERLRTNHDGFREGKSTVAYLLALRRIIEGINSNHLSAVITFLDFKKVFGNHTPSKDNQNSPGIW